MVENVELRLFWFEIGENQLTGPQLVMDAVDKVKIIRDRLQVATHRQKMYAGRRRKPLAFEVGDRVMLQVSLWKGEIRSSIRGKLNPRYIRPLTILEKVGEVAYRLELPEELKGVHPVFHISNLKKCLLNKTLKAPLEEIQVDERLNFFEKPIEIVERHVKRLRRKKVLIVKVKWEGMRGSEFTWEP